MHHLYLRMADRGCPALAAVTLTLDHLACSSWCTLVCFLSTVMYLCIHTIQCNLLLEGFVCLLFGCLRIALVARVHASASTMAGHGGLLLLTHSLTTWPFYYPSYSSISALLVFYFSVEKLVVACCIQEKLLTSEVNCIWSLHLAWWIAMDDDHDGGGIENTWKSRCIGVASRFIAP